MNPENYLSLKLYTLSMKKIFNSIFIIALTALSLGACDKIEEGNYIVFSGASGEWFDG